jgi:hypothetical protein
MAKIKRIKGQTINYKTLNAPRMGEGGILFYLCPSFHPSKIIFVAFFSVTVDGRNLIFGHKRHIGTPYRGKRFWTHQIPTSCLSTLLIFIHIEHMCTFFVTFFSATIDGRNLIWTDRGKTVYPCPPTGSGGIIIYWFLSKRWQGFWIICFLSVTLTRRGTGVYCFTSVCPSVRPRYFLSHFSQ